MKEQIPKKKDIALGIFVILISGMAGFMVHAEKNGNENQKTHDATIKYCKNEILPAYEAGFMTSLIKDLDVFALNCVGGDVSLYSWGNMDGSKNGILFRCNTTQEIYPLKYPDAEKYK